MTKLSHIINKLIIGKIKYQKIFEKLYSYSIRGMNFGNSNLKFNGELNAIKYVKSKLINKNNIVIFDVGANVGNYTKNLLSEFEELDFIIYAFEPSKLSFAKLKNNVKVLDKVALYNFGFGDVKTSLKLYRDEDYSGLASLYHRRLDHFNVDMDKYEIVDIQKIDDFCSENDIGTIDLLKLDVEGHELKVLQGAERMMTEDRIRFIQFEFGGCNIDSRTYFQDYYYLLKEKYNLFRIVKNGLFPISQYKETYEIFTTINYLAEHK